MEPGRYRIVVRGGLSDRFSPAFGGLALHAENGLTCLEGEVRDRSELYGLLERARELGLELVRVEPVAEPPSGAGGPAG